MFRFRTQGFPYTRLLTQSDPPQFTSENIALSCFDRQIILAAACTTYRYVVMEDVVMEDVAEKVESIESRLNELVEHFKTLFWNGDHRSMHTCKQPSWMAQLCKALDNISADLRTVKATLSTRMHSDNYHSPADTMANAMIENETRGGAHTQILCEPTPPAAMKNQEKARMLCQEGRDPHARPTTPLAVRDQVLPAAQSSEAVRPLRKPVATHNRLSRTDTKTVSAPLDEPPALTRKERQATQTEIQPSKAKVAPQISILFEAVRGKEAFRRLRTLVRSWRDRSMPLFDLNKDNEVAVQLVRVIGVGEGRSPLIEFLIRFAKVKLADVIDSEKAGRSSADPASLNKLMDGLKWARTKRNRTRLHDYLKEGRRWRRLCGNFDGLLCLIPPNREDREATQRISGRIYYELSQHDIQQFHSLLSSDQSMPLSRIGNTLQMSIWQNTEIPEFEWESEDPQELDRLSAKELAPFMREFHLIGENEVAKYEWPKPDCWPWAWPRSPSWLPPSDPRCDLCSEGDCNCIFSCLPQTRPRISNEPGKGQGVRAVGIYRKDQILGELLGEFVPLDTFNDGWAMEFRRPDLSDEPVAQIYSKKMGNWVRKVNHSCDPSAEFKVMKISGTWRQMIVAVRDISHDEEITAFCGTNFLRGQEKTCVCSACSK